MVYTSVDNEKIKEIKKLSIKKYRDDTNTFLVEGEHLIKEASDNGLLKQIFVLEDYKLEHNLSVETNYCSLKVMKYLSELTSPSKVIGVCNKKTSKIYGNKILMLDGVQDPGNLGTIIRSSVAFNVDTVILSSDCADLYNSKVIRASQGMIFSANIVISDLKTELSKLSSYTIYGTKVDGGNSLKKIDKKEKTVIIMGNEGSGVSSELLELCDEYLYIDTNSNCESLNVAVATSIILYELDK